MIPLPAEVYPFLIELVHAGTGEVVWTRRVQQPKDYALVRIPPMAKIIGHRVRARLTFADGTVHEGSKKS